MQKQSPLLRLWEFGSDYHSGLLRAILSAFIGVLCGMIPYFAAAQILIGLIQGERDTGFYLTWCTAALAGYLLRAVLYALALSMSHRATFSILKNIRERLLAKLPKMPLGTVVDASSGQLKQIIVDGGGKHGASPGPSASGDDVQSLSPGLHFYLSFRSGLENGSPLSRLHSCGNGVYDGGDEGLRKAV